MLNKYLLNFYKVQVILIIIIVILNDYSIYALGIETADPEASLKPRHYNPHPYLIGYKSHKNQQLVAQNTNYLQSVASDQVVKRKTSSNIYNQGPIQFPTNNENEVNDENDLQQLAPNPYDRLSLKPHKRVARPSKQQLDDDPNIQPSKKHYAFSYTVRDAESGDDFSHSQKQEDGAVHGSYKVQLPDGRTQIVKYTADNNGYKAEVTYVEGQIENTYAVQPTASTINQNSEQPAYSYYPNSQTEQEQNNNYLDYSTDDRAENYRTSNNHQYLSTTPTTYYASPTAISASPQYRNHIDVNRVNINTYNAGPHQYYQPLQSTASTPLDNQQHTQIYSVSPTTSYKDINVLPSPKPILYSTAQPYVVVSPKSTNIISSTYNYNNNNNNQQNDDYYVDYDYNNKYSSQAREYSLEPAQATPTALPVRTRLSATSNNVYLQPNQALYYKNVQK